MNASWKGLQLKKADYTPGAFAEATPDKGVKNSEAKNQRTAGIPTGFVLTPGL
jgi:hypothetical protein